MVDLQREEQAIRSRISEWVAAFKTKDAKKVAQYYANDGRLLVPHASMAQGRYQVEAAWAGRLPKLSLTFSPVLIEIAQSGEMAYDIGNYSLEFDGPQGPVRDEGKYVVVWIKEDGQWKVRPVSSIRTFQVTEQLAKSWPAGVISMLARADEVIE